MHSKKWEKKTYGESSLCPKAPRTFSAFAFASPKSKQIFPTPINVESHTAGYSRADLPFNAGPKKLGEVGQQILKK